MANGEVKVTVRLPADLHARIVALARRDHRSMNGELIALLEAAAQFEERHQS